MLDHIFTHCFDRLSMPQVMDFAIQNDIAEEKFGWVFLRVYPGVKPDRPFRVGDRDDWIPFFDVSRHLVTGDCRAKVPNFRTEHGLAAFVLRQMVTGKGPAPDLLQIEYRGNSVPGAEKVNTLVVNYQQAYASRDPFNMEYPNRQLYRGWEELRTYNDFTVVGVEDLYNTNSSYMATVVAEFAQYMLDENQMVMVMGPSLGNNHTPEFVFRKL